MMRLVIMAIVLAMFHLASSPPDIESIAASFAESLDLSVESGIVRSLSWIDGMVLPSARSDV
jgi:hypothetical protein